MTDKINHPDHYTVGGIECIDYLKAKFSKEEFIGFLKGNALKYITRAGHKESEIKDIQKALWYINKLENLLTLDADFSDEKLEHTEKSKCSIKGCSEVSDHTHHISDFYYVIGENIKEYSLKFSETYSWLQGCMFGAVLFSGHCLCGKEFTHTIDLMDIERQKFKRICMNCHKSYGIYSKLKNAV